MNFQFDCKYYSEITNLIPFPLLVVDEDVRIFYWNISASKLLSSEVIYGRKGGDVLHCLHSTEVSEGCGHSTFCKTCVIRNAVVRAIKSGKVYREKTVLEIKKDNVIKELPFLVTTTVLKSAQNPLIILILEDIYDLIQISNFLPICAKCKKMRTKQNEWVSVEKYIKENIVDVNFTHGLCPDCIDNFLTSKKS